MSAPLSPEETTAALRLALAEVERLKRIDVARRRESRDLTQFLVRAELAADVLKRGRNAGLAASLLLDVKRIRSASGAVPRSPQVEIFEGGGR